MDATSINALCEQRGWSRARLIHELRRVASVRRESLPSDESLLRMVREWANGRRGLSTFYAELLTDVFGVRFGTGKVEHNGSPDDKPTPAAEQADELKRRLDAATTIDDSLVALFEAQTQSLRLLDRQLGAANLLAQTEAHVEQMSALLRYSLPGAQRTVLAAAVAEAAALAGWQALDLGDPAAAWQHHETAKAAARESGSAAILAHVTAQQAFALLDLDQPHDARAVVLHAEEAARGQLPPLLSSWLSAARAEAAAACGDDWQARQALDQAAHLLPDDAADPELPFLVLDEVHLLRWQGHCLARLGSADAIDQLSDALRDLDSSFTRAAAGLHCDIALAHAVRGDLALATSQAQEASRLAAQTGSVRQRRRIKSFLSREPDPGH
ncbi:hypothetical protein G1H11_11075 [Phytoactinopolyspora alkaliphila]|uniref:XRE family transcriptional regulator n=1 Tax=Phytoactinopolyspora alkaliphila TaxID=1783498 RepID=A0A6N9YLI2_9ACTN|nr:hypothetical protein [Phytoactinopolyspora alkaliphila]NED95853.1 hypothetical protein [Phytoactinopolyspora alkaliphila]